MDGITTNIASLDGLDLQDAINAAGSGSGGSGSGSDLSNYFTKS
jgi:hypothetical protein